MENIDSDFLLNYYFKDGFFFHVPDRLIWNTFPHLTEAIDLFNSSTADVIENWDHYYQVYLEETANKSERVLKEVD